MEEFLTADTEFSFVMLMESDPNKLLLMVEGPDDKLLLEQYASQDLLISTGSGGRSRAISVACQAEAQGIRGVRFLIDRDYDDFLDGRPDYPPNVIVSDTHDCFTDLLVTDSALLRRIIGVYSDSAKRRSNPVPPPSEIERQAVDMCLLLSAVRIVSLRWDLSLNFKRFKFGNFKKDEIELDSIIESVHHVSGPASRTSDEIRVEAGLIHTELRSQPFSIIGDHDLFNATAFILQKHRVNVKGRDLHNAYILAAKFESIKATKWCKTVQQWCEVFGLSGFGENGTSVAA